MKIKCDVEFYPQAVLFGFHMWRKNSISIYFLFWTFEIAVYSKLGYIKYLRRVVDISRFIAHAHKFHEENQDKWKEL